MDNRTEILKRLLIETAHEWLERNKNAIGDKWYEKIRKELNRANSIIYDRVTLMGYALWLFNILVNLGVIAVLTKSGYHIININKALDQRTTKRLIVVIHMCTW